jgi:hypothetical protein
VPETSERHSRPPYGIPATYLEYLDLLRDVFCEGIA